MSYARLGPDSDVYVFESELGIHCHHCPMGHDHAVAMSRMRAVLHLLRHVVAGDRVPVKCFTEMVADWFR